MANDIYAKPEQNAVPMNQKIYYGFGQFGSGMIIGIFGAASVKFYSDVVGLNAAVITIVFAIYSIWNAINDPIFGYLSDRIQWKGKNGHRIPWLRRINPFLALFFGLTWFSPIGDTWKQFVYLLVMLILYDTCYTIIGLNQSALLADMSTSTTERSKIQLIGGLFGGLSAIGSVLIPSFLLTSNINLPLFQSVMIIIALISLLCLEITAYKVKIRFIAEPEVPMGLWDSIKESIKNKSLNSLVFANFTLTFLSSTLTGALFYFTEYVLHATGTQLIIPMLFIMLGVTSGAILLMKWGKTIGLKAAMLRGVIIAGIGLICIPFMPGWTIYIPMIFVGFGVVIPLLTFNVFIGDLADEDELKTGNRREGMFFGYNALIVKPAQSLSASFIVNMLQIFKYLKPIQEGDLFISQPQSNFTVLGIKIMFGLIPGLFVLLGAWLFSHYDLTGEKLKKVKEDLLNKNRTREKSLNISNFE